MVTPNSRGGAGKADRARPRLGEPINDEVGKVFAESQIYRIDHYLGKETVQNLLALRFANSCSSRSGIAPHIDHVQITVAETVGVEERGGLLRQVGRAARHGAEPLAAAALHRRHGAAHLDRGRCGARREVQGAAFAAPAERPRCPAQDRARPVSRRPGGGAAVPGYPRSWATPAVPRRSSPSRRRWRTGAGPARRSTCAPASACRPGPEIVIRFQQMPHSIFPADRAVEPNSLVIRLQPDEGIRWS